MNRSDTRCPTCGCPQSPEWALDWPRPSDVVAVGAHLFRVSSAALTGESRAQPIVSYRHVVMAACRLAGFSHPRIGEEFGRDHSVSMYACSKVAGNKQLTEMAETVWNTTLAGRPT